MAQTLQARIAARGFPVFDSSGQSGQGALPDSTRPGDGSAPGQPTSTWTDPNVDPGSVAAVPGLPEEYILGATLWGLSGASNPNDTPKSAAGPWKPQGNTHAAPFADSTLAWQDGARKNSAGIGDYNAELEAAHAPEFNSPGIRHHPGIRGHRNYTHQDTEGSPPGPLQPLTGQIRSMAGLDGVQGYGGYFGNPEYRGVNGTNATRPLTVVNRQFPGETYHGVFLSAAEVPLLVPSADQFIPSAPEFGPWLGGGWDVPTASVSAQDAVVADSPAQGPPVAPTSGLLPSWGALGG